MDKDFESELKGSLSEATAAKTQIAKYFEDYGEHGQQEAKKHQLIFASKIMCIITKCQDKHLDIYCSIISDIFADHLRPEASAKYWALYVNCIRYFHYLLVNKKDFEKASLIYKYISSYNNKIQNSETGLTCINIYCYQLLLQNSLKPIDEKLAIRTATDVIENLGKLFNELLDTNTKRNFQYPDILNKTMTWLFPQAKVGVVYQFLKELPQEKLKQMFRALFALYGQQTIDITSNEKDDVHEHAKFIIETIYTMLQVDLMDKMQLQLSIELLANCRTECRLQSNKAIAGTFLLLDNYLKLLCGQKPTINFEYNYSKSCERFTEFFAKYSKSVMNLPWFGDFLVLLFYLHSQLQNVSIFACFWRQMYTMSCFKSMFQLFVEFMKLAPCISSDTKLLTINCCTSTRKHAILSFAQIALASFVFYCQNVNKDDDRNENMESGDKSLTDFYKENIENNIILIVNHALKIIDRMDCITSSSQQIDIILTRFKQATQNCRTSKEAGTCVSICELFLKIKNKIAAKEWPLLLRRLYKTVTQLVPDNPKMGRELQMCYIASMLQDAIGQIDINQIRTQISIFYANETTTTPLYEQQGHEHCLLQLYCTTNLLLKPHLDASRKKMLHWLESQHILKYYKSNTALLHSLLKNCQSYYDFVVITKLGKLQTYAMAKISSLYKSLKSKSKESCGISRLEQLTFTHVCVMLLNDMNATPKFQIDSKDLAEDQLENLFMRQEMASFFIHNDAERFRLAGEALKAFEYFYEKIDSEPISMDNAIIDWESILDDLGSLALYFQLSGYMEYSSQTWFLHYKCSRLLQDEFSALRGLAFFCEYSEHCEPNISNGHHMKLEEELEKNFPSITQGLANLNNLQRHTYQSYILLVVVQIAHYYARTARFSFAQMLLQFVQQKHAELDDRRGRYDIVLATMDAVKFRLLWKHFEDPSATMEEKTSRRTAENLLLHRCLLHEVEETLERFHDFSCISSCDGLLYSILIINLVQEFAECTVNRLCDNFINSFFIAASKCTLLLGLALRFVQVMSMWMWVNLQMEYVDKAQVKLKIIECVLGVRSLKEITEKCKNSLNVVVQSSKLLPTTCSELLMPHHHNPGLETIRKLAQVQLSPIKTDKLQLSPSHRNYDLTRYFKCKIDTKLLPLNEQIEWTFYMVGCLNARLYFLVEDYDQLEAFYESGSKWLQMCKNNFNKKYYKNIELMALQHNVNFLRATRKYDKALKSLEYGIVLCKNKQFYIDATYNVNFQLQLIALQNEMSGDSKHVRINLPTHNKVRKALQFNISPENKQQQDPAKIEIKEKMLKNLMASGKKSSAKMKPIAIYATDCSSTKKIKSQAGESLCGTISSSSSSSSSSSISGLDSKTSKPNPKFKICEDSVEIIDIINNIDDTNASENDNKLMKRAKKAEENELLYKTPKVVRKTTRSCKTTAKKPSAKSKGPELIPQFYINLISDSPSSSSLTKLTKSSSLENLKVKENLQTDELVEEMQNLGIKSCTKTKIEIEKKATKSRRKLNPAKDSETINIVLDDSPLTVSPAQLKFRTLTATKDQTTNSDNLISSSRTRRQRKCVIDNNENASLQNVPTPLNSRRRQKTLF